VLAAALFPSGFGQMLAGSVGRGLAFMAVSFGLITAMLHFRGTEMHSWVLLAWLVAHIISVVDASSLADRVNAGR
jgi:hypothetical protein